MSLSLKEFSVVHYTMKCGSLFHSPRKSLVKKNIVQSSYVSLHFSVSLLFLIRDKSSIENYLFASRFVNPLCILKHYNVSSGTTFLERTYMLICSLLQIYDAKTGSYL